MLAVIGNVCDEVCETLKQLRISAMFVIHAGGAHIDFELHAMKRVLPRSHLRVNERAAAV